MLVEENLLCSFGGALKELKGIAGVPCLVTRFGGEGLRLSKAEPAVVACGAHCGSFDTASLLISSPETFLIQRWHIDHQNMNSMSPYS